MKIRPIDIIGWVVFGLIIIGLFIYVDPLKKLPFELTQKGIIIPNLNTMTKAQKAKRYDYAKEIVEPAGFINTDGITVEELIGKKVIMLDVWTYSCINCQRTLPYITGWYEKYKDQGLEIIGVHTPEFAFEKKKENVQWAVDKYNIKYPVVLDNDYGTWHAYRNRYWPRKYLIDIDGFVVYDHIGEGGYEETERKIQELLKERMTRLDEKGDISQDIVQPEGVEKVPIGFDRSPEIYFGAWRNTYLGNGRDGKVGVQNFSEPEGFKTNILYFAGEWDIQKEYAENKSSQAKIIFRYQAQKVFIVARADQAVKLKILRDGQPVGEAGGSDVVNGEVTVKEDRLYRLIEDPQGHGEHTLEIIIESPGFQAFAFTFG
jgi:thiol-disulfide isomerase/thioredoxin